MITTDAAPVLTVLGHVALHGEESHGLGDWALHPTIVAGTALFVALYWFGTKRWQRPAGEPLRRRHAVFFLLGTGVFFLALVSPLDVWSDEYLFSAHMAQHILLTMIAPPLWLLGTPEWLLRPLIRRQSIAVLARGITHPAVAFTLFNLVFWGWHWPAFYNAAVSEEAIHALQHLSFVAVGVINWWPVLGPLPELARLNDLGRAFYLFICCQPGVALGALFVFARGVLYEAYLDAPRLFGLSALADQQLGGLIMWIPGNAIYLAALSIIFLRWVQREDRETELP